MMAPALRNQATLAASGGGQGAILREAPALGRHRPTTLAAGIRGQGAILGEAAFVVGNVGTTFAGDLALLFLLHAGETTRRPGAVALLLMSHSVASNCVNPAV